MAERNPTFTPEVAGDVINYKPLSLLAVAGLTVAGVFTFIVLLSGILALVKGEPFFLADWMIFVPIGAAVLSGLGLWEVSSSEGTRAGAALARWGLWISILVGVGYFTYELFTGLAIRQQANRFVMEREVDSGFFPRLQGNEIDARTAYLFTMSAAERSTIRLEDPRVIEALDAPVGQNLKGRMTSFLESPLVRVLRQSPASAVNGCPAATAPLVAQA